MQTEMAIEGRRVLVQKFERLGRLDESDREALMAVRLDLDTVAAGEHLVREGADTPYCCLLISGYACRYKTAANGDRQIVSFHLPGDILAFERVVIPEADHSVQTIAPSAIAWIASDDMRRLAVTNPAIGTVLWRETLIEASIFREWVLNVARRDAKSRVTHMLCEFVARHVAAGLGDPRSIVLPLGQTEIADATGLAPVHVNRTLQDLTHAGIMARDGGHLTVVDWERMQEVAGFDARYLHKAA